MEEGSSNFKVQLMWGEGRLVKLRVLTPYARYKEGRGVGCKMLTLLTLGSRFVGET